MSTGQARARQWAKKPKPPSNDDKVQEDITQGVVKALVDSLRPLLADNPHRLLRTLEPHEVYAMAVDAITAHNAKLAEHGKRDLFNDRIDDLFVFS